MFLLKNRQKPTVFNACFQTPQKTIGVSFVVFQKPKNTIVFTMVLKPPDELPQPGLFPLEPPGDPSWDHPWDPLEPPDISENK